MIAVVSDTHSRDGHALEGRALEAVRGADVVVHAGDFTSETALDAFYEGSEALYAVHGNADDETVQDRLPEAHTLAAGGIRIAVTHRQRGGTTGLAFFGRERAADLVVSGHTHQPSVTETEDVTLLNPGSHADPRGNPASHAELVPVEGCVRGEIKRRNGEVLREFEVDSR